MDDTPTSKVLGVFIDMTELNGTAETTQPVTSLLAQRTCVFYQWQVLESWSDKGGKDRESGWIQIADGGEMNPFYLQDDTGAILVRPGDAKLEVDTFFSKTVSPDDPLYYSRGGTGLAASVRGIAEKYPQLTAQAGFTSLQKELVQTEERIALARDYYNDIATEFATRLEIVPDRWVAKLRGIRPEPLWQAADFERAAVKAELA